MKGKLRLKTASLLAGLSLLATLLFATVAAPAMAYPAFWRTYPPVTGPRSTLDTVAMAAVIAAFFVLAVITAVVAQRGERTLAQVTPLDGEPDEKRPRKAA